MVTFAGREKRMSVLSDYVHEMLKEGTIDEWHIWDFTRNESDRNFLKKLGSVKFLHGHSGYQYCRDINCNSSVRIPIRIPSELYLAFVPEKGDYFIEALIGGWNNGQTRIRIVDKKAFLSYERSSDDKSYIFIQGTPGVLSDGLVNNISIKRDIHGNTTVEVDDYHFRIPSKYTHHNKFSIYMRTDFDRTLEFVHNNDKIKRFIGNVYENSPYYRAYHYYASRYDQFENDIFLKCDDDIVYIELDKIKDFIEFTKKNEQYFVVSANVVNNATCAYLQQKNKVVPETVGHYENPREGVYGSLWESGKNAEKLHNYFIDNNASSLSLEKQFMEFNTRYSINFIAWRGEKLRYMSLPPYADDEFYLTAVIPQYLNKKTAIYSDFMVAHLTFNPQEKTMDVDKVIKRYDQLKKDKYKILA